MPRLGMTMREGRVVAWPVPLGGRVEKGQTVVVIESEKAEVEVEATASGFLRHVYVEPSEEMVPCGALLAALTDASDEPFSAEAFRHQHDHPEASAAGRPAAAPAGEHAGAPRAPRRAGRAPTTPAARRRARELGIDPARVPGTGPAGRVTIEDVEAFAERRRNMVQVAEGVALEVPRQGTGDPLLLLPGFGTDVSVFTRQVPALAEHFEVLGVNPRGVGGSDAPETPAYPVEQAADDAAAVASGPAHLVGTSLGAAVALEMAVRHPERVRSLALLAPFAGADGRFAALVDAWCRIAAEAGPELLAAALLPWLFSPRFLADDSARARTLRGLAATLARVPAATLARSAAGLRSWSAPAAALAKLDVPTLVVVGGADLVTPGGEALARAIAGARCVVIDDAGHAVGLEAPEAVGAALGDHLDAAR
jgi:pyruvate dehydrogenase E2 component (dihydrolipoamide acetyltransferase)